jgi:meso-butanediol dehydrogenase / (S,S)-butanediol dehydrogenase / diacetyl reductase
MPRMNPTPADLPVAIVTGAARGIGAALAHWFLQRDFRVALWDRDAATLAATQATLAQRYGAYLVMAEVVDVSQASAVHTATLALDRHWGRADTLVNNAGIAVFKPTLQTSLDEWRAVLATNLDGPFICTQAVAPLMLRNPPHPQGGQRGAVVNIASISGLRASTLRVAYGTSKAALIHLTRQHAVELGAQGIRVNAVAPGPVDTAMAKAVHTPAIRRDYHDTIALNRYGTEDEIAHAVGFLCSPAASYINGQVLAADGGFEAAGVGLPTLRRDLGLS